MIDETMLQKTVGELVKEKPARAKVFEKFGMNYCCGGKIPLAESCEKFHADLDTVLHALSQVETEPSTNPVDLSTMQLEELIHYVVDTHHQYLNDALPRLQKIVDRVVHSHGAHHPSLHDIASLYQTIYQQLSELVQNEERVAFPLFLQLSSAGADLRSAAKMQLHALSAEHDEIGIQLKKLRQLTDEFQVSQGMCNSHRAMLDGFSEFEADTLKQIHIKNTILFPLVTQKFSLTF